MQSTFLNHLWEFGHLLWHCCCCLVTKLWPTLLWPHGLDWQAPLFMGFSRQEYWSGLPCPPPGNLPNPGIEPTSPALQADSLLAEPQGKPKNTGVGSLSLLQGIFLIQESNQGLLRCRWILYQLSYQGSQRWWGWDSNPFLSPLGASECSVSQSYIASNLGS